MVKTFNHLLRDLGHFGKYYSIADLNDPRYEELPYSIRILLESAIRNCDEFEITSDHVETILNWKLTSKKSAEISFKPSRVLLQDLTGVPAQVDLAAMRDTMARFKVDPELINPLVPVDLVIDHSIQVDISRLPNSYVKNQEIEFERNRERFAFLKWAATAFKNLLIVPPGSGIVHQVNLEYLARVVFIEKGLIYPDSLVGTDSHTTMIDGLGIAGWGVGGIEAEAVMLGQPISMILPEVVGFKLEGRLPLGTTATDLALKVTRILREKGVVGKFVEFYGPGCQELSVADRATLSNMSPEYGATMGFFPIDQRALAYLRLTGRDENLVQCVEQYYKAQHMFRHYDARDDKIKYTTTVQFDLSELVPCVAGPKRPHDLVPLISVGSDFSNCLTNKPGFKGFGLTPEQAKISEQFTFNGQTFEFTHGTIVIAAITSCTNTSNPHVMLGAGLVAKKAVELGLTVKPFIKTSLSPGSLIVTRYLKQSKLLPYLEQLGFYITGFGCQTCIGNSGDLAPEVLRVIEKHNFVATAVLSGNRNFEGRIHPSSRANYLMSPILVVIYALAGTINIDINESPIGYSKNGGTPVYLKDLLPDKKTIDHLMETCVISTLYQEEYSNIKKGVNAPWNNLQVPTGKLCQWDATSTYIHDPPYLKSMPLEPKPLVDIKEARCLLFLGDSVTTDHISPAGAIARGSPAAQFLESNQVEPKNFNTYGSRRGNDLVMVRGTFSNSRLVNRMANKVGPFTRYFPQDKQMFIYDAAMLYSSSGTPLIVIAGKDYGSGSSRDWAAKGPNLLGIRAVLAQSYERIHRSNLIGMGIIPLQFMNQDTPDSLNLKGDEIFTIHAAQLEKPNDHIQVDIQRLDSDKISIQMLCRIDTLIELEYYKHGGILQFVLRKIMTSAK